MKISVFITCFNQQAYIHEAIESVLAQTLRPHQIIIVDDASKDDSLMIIRGYKSRYPELIEVVAHQTNQGVAHARSNALRHVTGDYVTLLDGDDYFMPTKLEQEAAYAEQAVGPVAVFSNYIYITADGQTIKPWASTDNPPPQGDVFAHVFAWDLPNKDFFRSELVPMQAWRDVGFYDPQLALYEDYDMRIRLTKRLLHRYCPHVLSAYRRHGQGLSDQAASIHLAGLNGVWQKDRHLLRDLPVSQQKLVIRRFNLERADNAARAARQRSTQSTRFRRFVAFKYAMQAFRYNPSDVTLRLAVETLTPELMAIGRTIKHFGQRL